MKPCRSHRYRAVLLLLLLIVSFGGLGLFSVVFPDATPAWLRDLFTPILSSTTPGAASSDKPGQLDPSGKSNPPHGSDQSGSSTAAIALVNRLDPRALPIGLTSIDGEGGTGINRAVKKNGVWYPVYSPGIHPGAGVPPLTVIPLSIASGNPLPGLVNQPFSYQAEAIGGSPPYTWAATITGPQDLFSISKSDGLLTGISSEPLSAPVNLTVTDSAGASDSTSFHCRILPEQGLIIGTTELPVLPPDEPVSITLKANGGLPPYHWSITGSLPSGLSLDPLTGQISGTTEEAGAWPILVQVTDSQDSQAQNNLTLICRESLDITTGAALPPASPGVAYHGNFEATGGIAPYAWTLTGGHLPDASWQLSPDGILSGNGSSNQQLVEFTLMVTDASEATFEKTFRLVVSDLLILVPSREKTGVAWPPAAVSGFLAAARTAARGFRVLRDGRSVYEGTGSNFVDHDVPTGSTPLYTLIALTTDGNALPIAEKETAILPQTLARAQPGITGDPYADRVVLFQPLTPGGYGSGSLPRNVTGPPDGKSVYTPAYKPGEVLSLHARKGAGGLIDLEFTDNIVELSPGEDLTVFENVLFIGGNGNQRFMEPAVISVALFPGEWIPLPCKVMPPAGDQPLDLRDPFYYAQGFAGRNGTTGDDPTNPNRSGGDSFDLNAAIARAGLTWIRYVRIQSTGDSARFDESGHLIRHPDDPAFNPLSGSGSSGFDLDAVSAVHY